MTETQPGAGSECKGRCKPVKAKQCDADLALIRVESESCVCCTLEQQTTLIAVLGALVAEVGRKDPPRTCSGGLILARNIAGEEEGEARAGLARKNTVFMGHHDERDTNRITVGPQVARVCH